VSVVKKEGYPYAFNSDACSSCEGRCCTGESGYIYVSKSEIFAIADLLNLSVNDFGVKYLYKNGYKYSIKEVKYKGSFECIFYDRESNGCKIYEQRPSQCITFPFWDYFRQNPQEAIKECPAINNV